MEATSKFAMTNDRRSKMKKLVLAAAAIAVVLTFGLGLGYAQNAAPGHHPNGWYCPYNNQPAQGRYSQQNTAGWYCPRVGDRQGGGSSRDYASPRYGGCMGYGAKYQVRSHGRHYNSWCGNYIPQGQTR